MLVFVLHKPSTWGQKAVNQLLSAKGVSSSQNSWKNAYCVWNACVSKAGVVKGHSMYPSVWYGTRNEAQQSWAHNITAPREWSTCPTISEAMSNINPFQSNFSANRILPSSYLFWVVKEVGGLLVIILQF
jgi:hypothetical protein